MHVFLNKVTLADILRRWAVEKQAVIKPGITPDLDVTTEKQAQDLSEEEKAKRLEDQDTIIKCGRCVPKSTSMRESLMRQQKDAEHRRLLGAIYHDTGRKLPPFAG